MNKSEVVEILAKKTALPKSKCDQVLSEFKSLILEVCSKGEQVMLRDFGKFSMQERAARRFKNPQTKRFYLSKPKKIICFKGYKNFKYAGVK